MRKITNVSALKASDSAFNLSSFAIWPGCYRKLHPTAYNHPCNAKRYIKEIGLTQVDLAMKSGVGLNFVRELEQGKATVRMDKVAQVFALFDYELVPRMKGDEL